jgi:hypothetical protein
MEKLKLSMLAEDVEISIEESHTVYTVAELKREITELGEPHHESANWYTIKREKWVPDAESMLDRYIDCEKDDLYEDWDESAWDCVMRNNAIDKIQAILDETFNSDYATTYWTYDKSVEIDIFPKNN